METNVISLLNSYPVSALELTVNIYKSHWWAIKFEEVAHKKVEYSVYIRTSYTTSDLIVRY